MEKGEGEGEEKGMVAVAYVVAAVDVAVVVGIACVAADVGLVKSARSATKKIQ